MDNGFDIAGGDNETSLPAVSLWQVGLLYFIAYDLNSDRLLQLQEHV